MKQNDSNQVTIKYWTKQNVKSWRNEGLRKFTQQLMIIRLNWAFCAGGAVTADKSINAIQFRANVTEADECLNRRDIPRRERDRKKNEKTKKKKKKKKKKNKKKKDMCIKEDEYEHDEEK